MAGCQNFFMSFLRVLFLEHRVTLSKLDIYAYYFLLILLFSSNYEIIVLYITP